MDIPAPDKSADAPDEYKVSVSVNPTKTEATTDEPTKDAKTPATSDDKDKVIAELIASKKYTLNIKEKHTAPLITLGISRPKDRKTRKNTRKVSKPPQKKEKKTESSKAKTVKLSIILLLWIGAYLALDMGLIDIGWRPPFTLIGPRDSAPAATTDTTN